MVFEVERAQMVERLRSLGYIRSERVIDAMLSVPRHEFVPRRGRAAYRDHPMEIGEGQTISAPHMVGIMLESLEIGPGQKVLEVGAGSGYNAACIAHIVRPDGVVYTIECVPSLARFAEANLERTGYLDRVTVIQGDGGLGLPEQAPYDRIVVTCAAPDVPGPLVDQMDKGGILLVPAGGRWMQDLLRIRRMQDGSLTRENLGGCMFVPLRGKFGVG